MANDNVMHTKLWSVLVDKMKTTGSEDDIGAIKKACNDAEALLLQIPATFPTYTLHNATHCKNVCNLMFDILGEDGVERLTSLETALLILSAYYHDIGMVYDPIEKASILAGHEFLKFQEDYPYAFIKIKENNDEVPDDIAEWYFRSIHTKRMERIPDLVIEGKSIKHELAAICKSHGNNSKTILQDNLLTSFPKEIADLVFCSVLLRIADILDFDKTRAPDVLFEFLKLKEADNTRFEESKKEYLKHKSALRFDFNVARNDNWKLPFFARCEDIAIEHDIRSFLDAIDKEFIECNELLSKHSGKWSKFPLPVSVLRSESYGVNYQYGQYLFTLEQDKAIELFTGENLYPNKTVFVRELLQNSIDTVLHRKLSTHYGRESYQPRIDVFTWKDNENYQWLRIDDNGMGMDERKIREYFLNAGKSYYNSDEFRAEILKYEEHSGSYTPISRFGIGVLSCFLAGDKVEVSSHSHNGNPVRLSIGSDAKYFKMQLKEKSHNADDMPTPDGKEFSFLNMPGTSIAVRIAPFRHAYELDFKEIMLGYIKYPEVPIYHNGEKLTATDEEFLADIAEDEIIEMPIPQEVIEQVRDRFKVEIKPTARVKLGLLNIGNYVTDANKEFLKGALFLSDVYAPYDDIFYDELRQHISADVIDKDGEDVEFCIRVVDHQVMLQILRNDYGLTDHDIPFGYRDWIEKKGRDGYRVSELFDIGINMNEFKWYKKQALFDSSPYLSNNIKEFRPIGNLMLTHNGIVYDANHRMLEFGNTISFIALCYDKFRPDLTLDRSNVQLIPLIMNSEINLAIRKAIKGFVTWDAPKNIFKATMNGIGDYKHSLVNIFYSYSYKIRLSDDHTHYSFNHLSSLTNFDCNNGWYDYFARSNMIDNFECTYLVPKYGNGHLLDAIYAALLQKYRVIKCYDSENHKIVFEDGDVEHNEIINEFYPPLFFLPANNEELLLVLRYHNDNVVGGFINKNNKESDWILARTETLSKKYPAIFKTFITAVYDGDKDEFEKIWTVIKSLQLF